MSTTRTAAVSLVAVAAIVAATGCAHAQQPVPARATDSSARRDSAAVSASPIGNQATLSQNDIAIRLRNDELEVRLVPLDIRVTALLARDGAASLQRLIAGHRAEIDSAASQGGVSEPGLALVTFFSQRDGVRFDPQLLTLSFQNRLLRPLSILALSPKFSSQQLDARESAMAIYVYEELLPVWDPFTVSYGDMISNEWERRLPTLVRERSRLAGRPQ